MRLVILQGEIFKLERKDILHCGIELHHRQRMGCPGELELCLFEVVAVEMHVAETMNELPGLESADLGHHQGQQCIGGDVERDAEEYVGAALVELAAEAGFTIGARCYIKLKERMAGHEGHLRELGDVP